MAVEHKFEVVEKEVIFSEGQPENPLKLFTVTGDALAYIIPVIKTKFSHGNATLSFGEQGKSALGSIDSVGKNPELGACKAVSGDIYQTVRIDEGENSLVSGTVVYYCVFAPLSENGEVEAAEEE